MDGDAISYSLRITFAAVASLLLARIAGLPETYWAPLTTLMALQPTFPSTREFAVRLVGGTALGAGLSAAIAYVPAPKGVTFGAGILLLGLITAVLGRITVLAHDHTEWAIYRFAGFALAIVILIPWHERLQTIALHRFLEVVIGAAVAVAAAAIWPVRDLTMVRSTQGLIPPLKNGVAEPLGPPHH